MEAEPAVETQSILNGVKEDLGLTEEQTPFDSQLVRLINSVFDILYQYGVGPETPFVIKGAEETWDQFTDEPLVRMCRTYVSLRVRKMFDTPTGSVLDAINDSIGELEWRLISAMDTFTDLRGDKA